MRRIVCQALFPFTLTTLLLATQSASHAQDRAGALMGGGAQVMQPPPGGAMPPPAGGGAGGGVIPPGPIPPGARGGGGGGGVLPPLVGNVETGAIPVTPPPIGYYAPLPRADYNIGKFFYYPFYYYPHNYWPTESCPWPERPGEHYVRPPAYMAYPPFLEPHWRYEWYTPQKYYRGFHFWLDQF